MHIGGHIKDLQREEKTVLTSKKITDKGCPMLTAFLG